MTLAILYCGGRTSLDSRIRDNVRLYRGVGLERFHCACFALVCRAIVGEHLRYQLDEARAAEQYAKRRLQELTHHSPSLPHKHQNHYSDYNEGYLPRSSTPGQNMSTSSQLPPATPIFPGGEQNGNMHLPPYVHHSYHDPSQPGPTLSTASQMVCIYVCTYVYIVCILYIHAYNMYICTVCNHFFSL